MIEYQKFILKNGLRVLVHVDTSTPTAAFNLLYDVGSRDESPDKTGFAHLFEHLMFGGSKHIKDFDTHIQRAGGENNAFTNSDMTNFYMTMPAQNLETAFWMESDRMLALTIHKKALNTQRKVVVEEFKETTLDEPYGDVWHHLGEMAFSTHPYRYPTIGKEPAHIEQATLEDVKDFYKRFYTPNNAILVIAGNVTLENVRFLAEKWFGEIPAGEKYVRNLPQEPPQTAQKRKILKQAIPVPAIYMAFHAPARLAADYHATDMLTDVLSTGSSSRLYRRLLKEQRLFTEIDCYQTGTADAGLLVVEGKPAEGVSLEKAEAAIWVELDLLKTELVQSVELQKFKHKLESQQTFGDIGALNKAMNLAYFEWLGNADWINNEIDAYLKIEALDIQMVAQKYLHEWNGSVLYYLPEKA
jgi:predicted Zn-dependent peptidase